MKDYIPVNPTFHESVPIVEVTEPVNADNNNAAVKSLQESVSWLKENSTPLTVVDGKLCIKYTKED